MAFMVAITGAEWDRRTHRPPLRLLGLRELGDLRERDGKLAGLAFSLLAAYGAVVMSAVGDAGQRSVQLGVVALLAASAAACFATPWRSLPAWTIELAAAWAIVLLGIGYGAVAGVLGSHAIGFAVVLGLSGLTGGWRSTFRLVGLALSCLAIAAIVGNQNTDRTTLAATIVVSTLFGQFVALMVAWTRVATSKTHTLRAAVTELRGATSDEAASNIVASAAARLADADAVAVMLTEHPGSTAYVCRGASGFGTTATGVRIETTREQSASAIAARNGAPLFVADAQASLVVSRRLVTDFDVASALYLPIPGEGGSLGVVVACWHRQRAGVDSFGQELVELLLNPAGEALERLRRAARHDTESMKDPLTGIGNRRRFDAGLTELPVGGAVLLFDLDDFKHINTAHGLDAGDETLRAFAAALRRSVRDRDIVTRFGSDKFGVILPQITSPIAGGVIIERLQRMWRAPHGCGFSVGIAIRNADETPSEAVARADNDLQATKRLKLK